MMINNSEYFDKLKYEYLSKNSVYLIEKNLFEVLSKEEFIFLIKDFDLFIKLKEQEYNNKLKLSYQKYNNLSEFDKYFIEMYYFYFEWWNYIKMYIESLNKIKTFYRLIYWIASSMKTIDIKNITIESILALYINIPSNLNRNIKCILPNHKDSSPSFRVYKNTNTFYCFGCRKWWNIINLISEIEQISTKEAFKKIVKLYNNK